jgi:hypothetical protein
MLTMDHPGPGRGGAGGGKNNRDRSRDSSGKDRSKSGREKDRDRDRDLEGDDLSIASGSGGSRQQQQQQLRRANVRTTTGYSRIVGKRRLPSGAHQNPKYAVDPLHKMSTLSALADRFMSFMNGETDSVTDKKRSLLGAVLT